MVNADRHAAISAVSGSDTRDWRPIDLRLQRQLGLFDLVVARITHVKAQFLAEFLHVAVLGQDIRHDAPHAFGTANLDEAPQVLRAQSLVLNFVGDDDRKFGVFRSRQPDMPPDAKNLMGTAVRIAPIGYQRDIAVCSTRGCVWRGLSGSLSLAVMRLCSAVPLIITPEAVSGTGGH